VDYFLLPLTTTLPTQLTPNAADTGSSQIPSLITGKQGTVLRFLETNYKSSWHGVEQELESSSKQASKQGAGRCSSLSLSLSLSNKASTRSLPGAQETAGVDRGGRPRRQASNRAVTVPGFSFCFLSLAQKTLFLFFLFFPLIKESTTKHPMNTYIPGNDDFFEN